MAVSHKGSWNIWKFWAAYGLFWFVVVAVPYLLADIFLVDISGIVDLSFLLQVAAAWFGLLLFGVTAIIFVERHFHVREWLRKA